MIEHTRATRATKPTVRPTAPPVLSPPPCPTLVNADVLSEFGGTVGVTVTVRTCPVTVSSDMTGVGVHVVVADELVVAGVDVGLCEVSDVGWKSR
jgi:hypothetical protein